MRRSILCCDSTNVYRIAKHIHGVERAVATLKDKSGTSMGNMVSPAKTPKVTKLKNIVQVLVEQQRKIKRSRQDAMRRQRQLHLKMKHNMVRRTQKKYADVGLDDDIREMAEEIAHQRHRILDLKVCVDTLRNLQYKVQSILNAYYTHTTLVVVNNAIKKTNIAVEKMDKEQGMFTSLFQRSYMKLVSPHHHKLSVELSSVDVQDTCPHVHEYVD